MEILSKDFVEFIEWCVGRDVKFLMAPKRKGARLPYVSGLGDGLFRRG